MATAALSVLSATLGCTSSLTRAPVVEAVQLEDRVRVTVEGRVFTEYRYGEGQKHPYFYPVAGPRSGQSVTTETSRPYPHHHSLFFASDKVNGGNYWHMDLSQGQIVPGETRLVRPTGDAVEFTQTSLWTRPGAEAPFRDERRIRISAPSPNLRLIDFDVTLTALIDVRIERTNHSLFAARMAPGLSVDSGGTLVNAHGGTSAAGTFGEAAPWADFSGARAGVVEGLAIFNHPENPWSPPPWFTRDYGFFSPTPLYWLESDHFELPKGNTVRLRYRVVVHGGDAEEARLDSLYQSYAVERP